MPKSQIQSIREQIELEIQSMHNGFYGFAAGIARHQFIEASSRRLECLEQQLAAQVGQEQALLFTCQAYAQQTKEYRSPGSDQSCDQSVPISSSANKKSSS